MNLRTKLNAVLLATYRTLGMVVLYAVLAGVIAYIGMTGFYAMNSTWVAPFIITPTNDKILDMTGKLVESQQTLNALVVDRDRLQGSMADMERTKAELESLDSEFRRAIVIQQTGNRADAPDIAVLDAQKRSDNEETNRTLAQMHEAEAKINADLNAGLITSGDAAVLRVQLRATKNTFTDGKISEVLLRDVLRSKGPMYTTTADTLAKEAELKSTLTQLDVQIWSGMEQLKTDKSQIAVLEKAVSVAQRSPYYLATKGNVNFAFAEYGTNHVKEGRPVFGCFLNMIICHQVGTVERVFTDEESAVHPVFHTNIRGVLIQLNLNDPEAAKDTVLFLGRKPLLF